MDIKVRSLGSSSSGNSTLIWDEKDAFLIDFGFGPKYLKARLKENNLDFSSIKGAALTHLHADHCNAYTLRELIKLNIPIYMHEENREHFLKRFHYIFFFDNVNLIQTFNGKGFEIGSFRFENFEVPHDSEGVCSGFSIYNESNSVIKKITYATDVGCTESRMIDFFKNSDAVIIESNHDLTMLRKSRRPQLLKDRISGSHGHLSNEQCSGFMMETFNASHKLPKGIILAHLSKECNTPALAYRCFLNVLEQIGAPETKTYLARQFENSELITI